MSGGLENSVTFVVALLAMATVVGVLARRLRLPYTVALLAASLPLHNLGALAFGPQVLFVFLPALIFEAAWNLDRHALRRTWTPVALLAVPGVVFTALAIGFGLALLGQLPLQQGLLLGSIVAATDPIAVIATFRRLDVPRDLATIVESESLLNDGAAVVLYGLLAAGGTTPLTAGAIGGIVLQALGVTSGGIVLGVAAAALVAIVLIGTDDAMLQVAGTVVAAYGSYLAAERLHVSGIFAAVTASVALHAFERFPFGDEAAREVDHFWAVLAFFANTFVFLLLGLRIDVLRIFHEPLLIGTTIALVIASRLFLTYGLVGFALPRAHRRAWQHVVMIAGMRGALSLALAVTLPVQSPHRAEIIDAVFAVVTVTLIAQGLAIGPVLRRLRLG